MVKKSISRRPLHPFAQLPIPYIYRFSRFHHLLSLDACYCSQDFLSFSVFRSDPNCFHVRFFFGIYIWRPRYQCPYRVGPDLIHCECHIHHTDLFCVIVLPCKFRFKLWDGSYFGHRESSPFVPSTAESIFHTLYQDLEMESHPCFLNAGQKYAMPFTIRYHKISSHEAGSIMLGFPSLQMINWWMPWNGRLGATLSKEYELESDKLQSDNPRFVKVEATQRNGKAVHTALRQ
ncbi:hypothetical protein L211DRAFT_526112 [Terfezia boudieri ATCC MYA-4762]|uniref:Uncharacterized protein n=1 Tax=Terfezia boudieri ATCC MYA-4762 TaxID=1051890 RepID=A0A3N4LQM3_9PEZI|nr:hypothetical protein L211DRAFT_526112 [Terfezia boudieri ATCC MYA-4762]